MIPASVAIERAGLAIDGDEFADVCCEVMPRWMERIARGRVAAVTIGSRIFLAPGVFDEVVAGRRPEIVVHELVHAAQWKAEGPSFLFRYLREYFAFRFIGISHDASYRSISYELIAYAAEHRRFDNVA